jgi:putative inorganic carbon (HCO3(-)) transporter
MVNTSKTRVQAWLTTLATWQLPTVIVLVVLSMASVTALPLAVAAIIFFAGVRILSAHAMGGRNRLIQTPVDLPVLVLCVTLVLTLWVTIQPEVTSIQVLRLFAGVGLFYALAHHGSNITLTANSRFTTNALLAFSLVGMVLAVSSPFVVEWTGQSKLGMVPAEVYQNFRQLIADGINPNVMAGALVILSPIPLAGLLFGKPVAPWAKLINAVSILAIVLALVLASSRSALAAFCLSAGLLLFLRWPRVAVIFSGVLVASFIGMLLARASVWPLATAQTSQGPFGGFVERSEIWMRALYLIQDFPITGVGMGNFSRVADLLYPALMTRPGIEHAHNLALQVAVDLGLPGLVAWLAIFGLVVTGLFIVIRGSRKKAGTDLALACGLLCSQVALVAHGITDAVTWGMVRSAPLVWALWGVSMAMWLVADPREGNDLGD